MEFRWKKAPFLDSVVLLIPRRILFEKYLCYRFLHHGKKIKGKMANLVLPSCGFHFLVFNNNIFEKVVS